MILASVPCIMISHDLGKGTMVNHDLARLTMIMASVPWLRTLGRQLCETISLQKDLIFEMVLTKHYSISSMIFIFKLFLFLLIAFMNLKLGNLHQ